MVASPHKRQPQTVFMPTEQNRIQAGYALFAQDFAIELKCLLRGHARARHLRRVVVA
jgi:hypothetical protein